MTGAAKTPLGRLTQGNNAPRKRPGRGRQTKLTPELSKKICDAIRAGNYASVAARYCGVGESTLAEWLARGRGTDSSRPVSKIYQDFAQAVDEAEAGAEVAAVLHWRAAMPKDWHASERWLDRRIPHRWGQAQADQARTGAFAGVQVNIGVGPGSASNGQAQDTLQAPLQHLLEENPELIAGTMQFLDQLLPIPGQTDIDGGDQLPVETTNPPIVDAEPGSWREIDPSDATD